MRNIFRVAVLLGLCLACIRPAFGLIISEFVQEVCDQAGAPPATGPASGQFIVVYHQGPGGIDLNGWTIGHLATAASSTITNTLVLSPGERVVFSELSFGDFEAEYGLIASGVKFQQIILPDFQAKDGIVFEKDAARAACNSGIAYCSPVPAGELAVWNSTFESWAMGGIVSRTCINATVPAPQSDAIATVGASRPLCPPTGPCEITSIEILGAECSSSRLWHYDVDVLIAFTNAPPDGMLTVNGQSVQVTQNPQPVTLQVQQTRAYTVMASFPSTNCARSEPVGLNLTGPCDCVIDRIEIVGTSACDSNGLISVTADIYAQVPENYTFDVATRSDDRSGIAYTGTPTRVRLNSLANGTPINVSARFNSAALCFLSTNMPLPACSNACRVTGVEFLGFSPCASNGLVTVDLLIRSENPNNNVAEITLLPSFSDFRVYPTGAVSQVSFTTFAEGQLLDLNVQIKPDCFLRTNLNINLPECPRPSCTLSNLHVVSFSVCDEADMLEVVTSVEFEPTLFTQLQVGGHLRNVTSSPMLFTNQYLGYGSTITIEASWQHPYLSDLNAAEEAVLLDFCPGESIDYTLPLCDCITSTRVHVLDVVPAGDCRSDGLLPVDVTVVYSNTLPNQELYIDGSTTQAFALTGSPQTERVLLTRASGFAEPRRRIFAGIRERVPVAQPVPFGPTNSYRNVCSIGFTFLENGITLPLCPSGPCRFLEVNVTSMECLAGGMVEVQVEIVHTNGPIGQLLDISDAQSVPLRPSPHVETFYRMGDGSVMPLTLSVLVGALYVPCYTNIENLVTLPVCSDPCELTEVVPVGVSGCDSNGMVDVTFEISATDATGEIFGVELRDRSVSAFFVYTNTPMQAVLTLPGDGSVIDVVAGQVIHHPFFAYDYNPDCAVLVDEIVRLPDCNAIPDVCLTNPALPECSCELISVIPVGISPCRDGIVDVTFEISATGANGSWFSLSDQNVTHFFLYTNSPMQVVLQLSGDGSSVDVVAGQANFTGSGLNTNCTLAVDDILSLPDCSAVPAVCLANPPAFLDMVTLPRPNFSFHLPSGAVYDLEMTTDLNMPWTPLLSTARGTNGVEQLSLWFQSDVHRFYRLRCRN